jgi:hypothetical protein
VAARQRLGGHAQRPGHAIVHLAGARVKYPPAASGSMVCVGDTAPDRGFFRLAGIEYSPAPCQAARTVQKKHSPKRDRPAAPRPPPSP